MNKEGGCAKVVKTLVLVPVLMVISVVVCGYTLSVLWGWFVVPTFGAPALSIPVAFGLSLIVSFVTYQETKSNQKTMNFSLWEEVIDGCAMDIIRAVFALLFGWIIHLFV